jgi:hypothetical protein
MAPREARAMSTIETRDGTEIYSKNLVNADLSTFFAA